MSAKSGLCVGAFRMAYLLFVAMKQFANFKRFQGIMAEILRQIIISMHGAFLPKNGYIDASIKDFEAKIFGDLEMEHPSVDRYNMYGDVQNLKSDFKKTVKKYKEEETVNG